MELVIFDLETTGFSPRLDDIIQIAAVRMRHGEVIAAERFETFVSPRKGIPGFISEITGITHQEVGNAPDPASSLVAFSRFVLCLVGAVLAIPGTILGLKQELIIYDGKDDLNGTCLVVMMVIAAPVAFTLYPWLGWGLGLLGLLMLIGSIRRTCRANETIGKSLLAVPTKFVVLGLIVVCGLLAISLAAGIRSLQQKKYKEGAQQLAAGAAGLGGYYLLKKLIGKLVRENRPK